MKPPGKPTIIFLDIIIIISGAYFLFFASCLMTPSHWMAHWIRIIGKPHIAVCGTDTIFFKKGEAVLSTEKLNPPLGCTFVVEPGPFCSYTFNECDTLVPKENTIKLLSHDTNLGRFDKATYIFVSEPDTIYLEYSIIGASDLLGYQYWIDIYIPGNRYILGLNGPKCDIESALDLIRTAVYRDDKRKIIFSPELTEKFSL